MMTQVNRAHVEQWMINKSLHYNEWMNLEAIEFMPVTKAFKDFLATMKCEVCSSYVYVTPRKGPSESIKCNCGTISINLIKKKS